MRTGPALESVEPDGVSGNELALDDAVEVEMDRCMWKRGPGSWIRLAVPAMAVV